MPSDIAPGAEISLEALASLREVPLTLRAELGRCGISGRDLLNLHPGSVIELPTVAGENISIHVQDVLLGAGEVLLVNNSLAVHVAELKDKGPDFTNDQHGAKDV